jgi:hypothetical protein
MASSSPGHDWNFPESESSSYFQTPTAAASTSHAPYTQIISIDPALQQAPSKTITMATNRGAMTGKAGALVKFTQYDQQFAEMDIWKAKMKATVEVGFRNMEQGFQDKIAMLKDQHKTEIEALHEKLVNDKCGHDDESESDGSDVEMVGADTSEASLAATKNNNFLVSTLVSLDMRLNLY